MTKAATPITAQSSTQKDSQEQKQGVQQPPQLSLAQATQEFLSSARTLLTPDEKTVQTLTDASTALAARRKRQAGLTAVKAALPKAELSEEKDEIELAKIAIDKVLDYSKDRVMLSLQRWQQSLSERVNFLASNCNRPKGRIAISDAHSIKNGCEAIFTQLQKSPINPATILTFAYTAVAKHWYEKVPRAKNTHPARVQVAIAQSAAKWLLSKYPTTLEDYKTYNSLVSGILPLFPSSTIAITKPQRIQTAEGTEEKFTTEQHRIPVRTFEDVQTEITPHSRKVNFLEKLKTAITNRPAVLVQAPVTRQNSVQLVQQLGIVGRKESLAELPAVAGGHSLSLSQHPFHASAPLPRADVQVAFKHSGDIATHVAQVEQLLYATGDRCSDTLTRAAVLTFVTGFISLNLLTSSSLNNTGDKIYRMGNYLEKRGKGLKQQFKQQITSEDALIDFIDNTLLKDKKLLAKRFGFGKSDLEKDLIALRDRVRPPQKESSGCFPCLRT